MPSLPPWATAIVAPIVVAAIVGAASSYGTFKAVESRLSAVESQLTKIADQDRSEAWGNLQARLSVVERRTSDGAFADWTSWRATVDSKITGMEVDIRDIQRGR